jgi:hypothetical protein
MTALDRKVMLTLAIIAVFLFGLRFWPAPAGRLVARVEVDGKLVQAIDLTRAEGQTIPIKLPRGQAELEVKDRAVRLLEMPLSLCPRQICTHIGWIRKPGETIVCLPNRLIIRLVSPGKQAVDVIVK